MFLKKFLNKKNGQDQRNGGTCCYDSSVAVSEVIFLLCLCCVCLRKQMRGVLGAGAVGSTSSDSVIPAKDAFQLIVLHTGCVQGLPPLP